MLEKSPGLVLVWNGSHYCGCDCTCAVSKHGVSAESVALELSTSLPVVPGVGVEHQPRQAIIVALSVIALVLVPVILSLLIAICVRECQRSEFSLRHFYTVSQHT